TCRPIHEADGVWRIGLPSARIIYRLPELISALTRTPRQPILVLEGEKDVEAAWMLGYVATTNVGGAGKWTEADSAHLRGRHVVVICDNDEAGRKHGEKAAASLLPVAESVRLIPALPGVPEKGDLSDWIAGGGTRDSLRELILATPRLPPPTVDAGNGEKNDSRKSLSNGWVVQTDDGEETTPLSVHEIAKAIEEVTGGWPCRVGDRLFVPTADGRTIRWLRDPPDLIAFIGQFTDEPPVIHERVGFCKRADIFAHLRANAREYSAVEDHPHEPPIPGVYYACAIPEPGDGRRLREVLDRFRFATDADRDLFQALLMTVLWGGEGGTRPAFLITADSGRGAGKTAAVKMVAQLVGGAVEVRANEDAAAVLKRLLSPDGQTKRLVLLDNVKSQRFSSADLEGLVTAPVLSGHRMYAGGGRRPNLVTFCVT
ncbi:MAG TPA: hypothetical protein VF170_20145, partial [Planctomycetaceae bacterium]